MNRHGLIVIIILLLSACASRQPAPVDEISSHNKTFKPKSQHRNSSQNPSVYNVKKGDSLYSIGFRYQIDYRTLAAINNIGAPYRIYPNQRLKLKAETNAHKSKKTVTQAVNTQPQLSIKKETTPNSTTQQKSPPKLNEPVTVKPVVTTTSKQASEKPTKAQKPTVQVITDSPNKGPLNWLWPTKGEIRTTFMSSNPARKGISIRGNEGQPVKAAEAGVVVYSGDGLLGYGELIIIKHNDTYLSAYGHNKKRTVSEGQQVKRGEVIALLGSSGTNVNNLHFEIRKNGQPVNPLSYVKP